MIMMIPTRSRPLTAADFEGDLPAPGSSDKRYSQGFLAAVAKLAVGDRIVHGFAPWSEDPDPPDRMTDGELKKLAEGARRLLRRSLAVEELIHRALHPED
jgi:hypothetical protein